MVRAEIEPSTKGLRVARRPLDLTPILLGVATFLAACGGNPTDTPIPTTITVSPADPQVPQKLTLQLDAKVLDAQGNEIPGVHVTYESSAPEILAVSSTGLLTSVGPVGVGTIVVRDGTLSGSVEATVTLRPSGITVTPSSLLLQAGLTAKLTAVVKDANGGTIAGAPVTFASDDSGRLTVASDGTVTSVGALGSTTITVTSGALQTTVPVTIAQIPGSMVVDPTSLTLPSGQSQAVTVTILDLLGQPIPGAAVTFTSNDPAIATVSPAGLVTSVGPDGETTITIASTGLSTQVTVHTGNGPAGTVLATLPLAGTVWDVAVTATGKYYATTLEGTVYAGTSPGYQFTDTFSTGEQAADIAVNAAGTTGYIAQGASGATTGITVVNLVTNTVTGLIPLPGARALSVELSADQQTLFVGSSVGLHVIDIPSGTLVTPSLAAGSINNISRQSGSALLYASVSDGRVLEIDGSTRTVLRTLSVGSQPQGTIASRDGTRLYIAIEGTGLQIWNLTAGSLEHVVPEADGFAIALSPEDLIYVVNPGGTPGVKIVDPVSRTLLRTTANTGSPRRIAFDPTTGQALVTNDQGWVNVVN
jgi:hypothetical protein